ncbi:MAG: NAD(P)/FAD-dependent oxidoreductase [Firmicutes bacterium]|nr:NAD(P)/FAD-dependent oxidoreductase [Bacillota bacterium]
MIEKDLIVIGGGPAGLSAAKTALEAGCKVLIIERNFSLGGQLEKQTHKFFGSEKQFAKTRGLDIAKKLIVAINQYPNQLEVLLNTTVVGLYKDYVVTTIHNDIYKKYHAKSIIIATGASEKVLAFENNDLPGIYGAGAVQTLMNLNGVLPGKEIVMVGSGNIGLIVSYQLIQAGVKVKALLEASPSIGGYLVHASKLKRLGVPIFCQTTIKRAEGNQCLEKIITTKLNDSWEEIPNTTSEITCDALCISVGLSPLHQLLSMADIKMKFVPELGGLVPRINKDHETSMKNVFVCGDVTGVEEASSAIVEGALTGLIVSKQLGYIHPLFHSLYEDLHLQLDNLRSGLFGKKTRIGLIKLEENNHAY